MHDRINESDWKRFRKLREGALDRCCQRTLNDAVEIANDDSRSHHERYLEMYRLIQSRDREIARAFNDPSRSRAILQILAMIQLELLDDEDLARFSDDTRQIVQRWQDV